VGLRNDVLDGDHGKAYFGGGKIGQCDVMYRENVAMWYRCSAPAAE